METDQNKATLAVVVGIVVLLGVWAYSTIHYGTLGFVLGWIPSSFLAVVVGVAIFLMDNR